MNINLQNKGITTLDFSSHDSVTASPKEVIALQLIESMDASHNRIVSIRHLSVFTALTSLNLAHNRLTSPVVDWFKALPVGLTNLNLSHNEISSIASNVGKPMSIGRLIATYTPRLLRLDLSYNLLHISSASNHGEVAVAKADAPVPAAADSALRELFLDHNTGLFSLNSLAADLPALVLLSAGGNHIESLEALAELASSSPSLDTVRLFDCAVARRLQDPHFLWNVMGGDAFNVQSEAERRAAQRDTAKLAPHFFASWVRQVLPSVKTVDGVSVAEADALVGPLLRGPAATRDAASSSDDDDSSATTGSQRSLSRSSSSGSTKSGSSDSARDHGRSRGAPFRSILHDSKPLPPRLDDPSEAPPQVLQRIDYLHRRVVELQAFIAESKRSLRLVAAEKTSAAAELSRVRQTVTEQRSEVAALRLSREAQLDTLRSLQHLVRKRTLELDHAEVANIRAVEKKAEDVVRKEAEVLQQQSAAVRKAQLRQKSRSGADAPPQPLRPTRSTMKQLEETHRRLQHLKHVSPTAALGTRFSYNEFGHPEFAIDSLERVPLDVMALHESPIAAAKKPSREMGTQHTEFAAEATRRSLSFDRVAVAEARASRTSTSLPREQPQRPSHFSPQEGTARKPSERPRVSGSYLAASTSHRDVGRSSFLGVEVSPDSHPSPKAETHPYEVANRAAVGTVESHASAAASAIAAMQRKQSSSSTNSRGTPPLSPKQQRRIEPDHAVTVLSSRTGTSWDMSAVAAGSSLLEFPPTDTSPASDLQNHSQRIATPREGNDELHQSASTNSASSPLATFRFPKQPNRMSASSSSLLLAPEEDSLGASPPSEDFASRKRASLRLQQQRASALSEQVEGRVLAAERRRSSTGHGADGSLSHPLTGLVGLAGSGNESQSLPHLESPENSTSVMRWTVGTSAQQMHLSSIYGDTTGGTSIATMSPTKRISESVVAPRGHGERRKPSDAILDEASRLVATVGAHGGTFAEAVEAETMTRSVQAAAAGRVAQDADGVNETWNADSMSAVPRGVHTARSKSQVHPYHFTGTGVTAIEFSLDESISKAKPNFRSHSSGR